MQLVELVGRPDPTHADPSRTAVVVDLDAGCRLRRITVTSDGDGDATGTAVELLAPVDDDADPTSTGWGSFPMAPWAGRIRHGITEVAGAPVALGRNHRDSGGDGGGPIRPVLPAVGTPGAPGIDVEPAAHAIHGTVFGRSWTIDSSTATELVARCPLGDDTDPLALGWPFGGIARQRISVGARSVSLELVLEATGPAFPAVVGWHPWFVEPGALEFEPTAIFEVVEAGLPTGRLLEPTPGPWDDCFLADGPITLRYDRRVAPEVRIDADADHWVIFDRPAGTICVEPQSGPPDAMNLAGGGRGIDPRVRPPDVVAPGHPLRRTMTIAW